MAGSQDQKENPVAINVVPMVDVIFCLCVFFMCSLKFPQLEGKFDSWLPRNKGLGGAPPEDLIQEVRVALFWDEAKRETQRVLGTRRIASDDELEGLLREAHDDYVRLGKPDTPVTIDAEARVPWRDVITVVNLCKRNGLEQIEFAFGAGPGTGKG